MSQCCDSGCHLPLEDYVRLPKVELHAHFFGSIRLSSVRRTAEVKKLSGYPCGEIPSDSSLEDLARAGPTPPRIDPPDIDAAFKYFSWVYSVVRTTRDMRQALLEVLEDFHNDNVVYLELRSSLKTIPEEGVEPQSYVDMLVEGCKEAERKWGMAVRLLVSLDRGRMLDEDSSRLQVEEAFTAASRYPDWIVGFDIAGRPDKGDIEYSLRRLKEEVLLNTGKFFGTKKLTVHTAEVEGGNGETEKILDLPPHRLGHGLYLTEKQQADVAQQGICVEVCPTSNMCTLKLRNMLDHPLQLHHEKCMGLRDVCICSDDAGLFQTSLSKELQLVAHAYGLSPAEVFDMQRSALNAAFCTQDLKDRLHDTYFSDSAKRKFVQMCSEPK